MRVFDFTLLSGYEFSGVDVAQGFRARLFAKNNVNAKFIFTELPTIRDMELYGSQKIKRGQIMSAHLFMTGRLDMSLSVKKEALLENEKENYEYDNIDEDGKVIRLYNSGEKSVEILCDEDRFVINESLFKNGKKYLENYYTDSLSYTELYNWDNDSNDGLNLAVIEDDGFLPDDVMSVYGFFLGDYREADSLPGKPLYFNQIQIPDYWRIEGDNSSAKVMDRTRERARIFFTEPTHRRQVKIVDWLDDAGQVRLSEHYNRYGAIFCHTVFNKKGQKALRKFFDVTGREMIVENFVTGDILVRWQDKDWIFRSKTDFIAFFIRCAGLEDTAVYFNSLSYPFFASQALAPNGFRDALFWHEPVGDEIPGNMQIILHDQGTRAKRVFVSRRESYDRLIALGAPSDKVKQLGYIYSFVRENKHRPHILVCTNSENVGHLTELASLMPQMHFHVAAITEMSSKLMSAGQYDNVSLYPNVKMSVLDSLFEKCDFYLDINHEGEIVDAVHRAFLNNMLIVGYEETMHNAYYTADTNTFKESEYADMAEALNLTLAMPHLIDEALAMQKKAAVAADATDYMEILHL